MHTHTYTNLHGVGGVIGECSVHNDERFPGQGLVHEGVAPAIGTQPVLQVLPVPQRVDSLVRADLLQ